MANSPARWQPCRCAFWVPEGAIQILFLSNCGCVCGPSWWLPEETAQGLAFVSLFLNIPQDRSGFPGDAWKHFKIKVFSLGSLWQRITAWASNRYTEELWREVAGEGDTWENKGLEKLLCVPGKLHAWPRPDACSVKTKENPKLSLLADL